MALWLANHGTHLSRFPECKEASPSLPSFMLTGYTCASLPRVDAGQAVIRLLHSLSPQPRRLY